MLLQSGRHLVLPWGSVQVEASVSVLIAAASLLVAVFGIYLGRRPSPSSAKDVSADEFGAVQRFLREKRALLESGALAEQRQLQADPEVPLLMRPSWILPRPIPEIEVRLSCDVARMSLSDRNLENARRRAQGSLPAAGGSRNKTPSYSAALEDSGLVPGMFNGHSYRLVGLSVENDATSQSQRQVALSLRRGRYYDGMDTSEVLAYESAARARRAESSRRPKGGTGGICGGPYRKWLGDPFGLEGRAAMLGVNVLTVRRAADRLSFFLHVRSGELAQAMGTTHVVPAGEFQPQADFDELWHSDCRLWHTAAREYAEEFLGLPDAAVQDGSYIEYDKDAPFSVFEAAKSAGKLNVWFLGIGLDPLSWKHEACLVAVWESDAFDAAFGGMVRTNAEGNMLVGRADRGNYTGIEFSERTVRSYSRDESMLPAGRACLVLAWRWRQELGLEPWGRE